MPPQQPDYAGLLKLLSLCIKQAGGQIRLTAAQIHDTEIPKGFTKRWDNTTKELVLELVEYGTALYVSEDNQWTAKQEPLQPLVIPQQQVDKLVERAWNGQDSQPPNPRIVLDDERVAEIDRKRRQAAAMSAILEFQPEREPQQPQSHTPRSTPFSINSSPEREVPKTFYK